MAFNLANVKVVKNVTLPLLKMKDDGTSYFVKLTSEIYPGKDNKTGKVAEGEQAQKVTDLIQVIDLETGEEKELIASAVFKAEVEEGYPAKTIILSDGSKHATKTKKVLGEDGKPVDVFVNPDTNAPWTPEQMKGSKLTDWQYLGKMFRMQKFAKADGKKYATFQIAEIAFEEEKTEDKPQDGELVENGAAPEHKAKKK